MENKLDILDRIFDGLKFKDARYKEKNNTSVLNIMYNPETFQPTD